MSKDWVMKCVHCGREVELGDILEKGCPQCGGGNFKLVKPLGKEPPSEG